MTRPVRWLSSPDEAAGWRGEPLAWVIAPDHPGREAWLAQAGVAAEDPTAFANRRDAGYRLERRRLARWLIARAAGRHPGAIAIERDPNGALVVDVGLHLSVAGSGGWTLIGLADEPVGADIERIDARPPLWDMLGVDEAATVRADADPPRAWLKHWVAKEAHAKRLGEPRRADPAVIAIAAGCARSPQGVSRIVDREEEKFVAALALPP